MPNTRRTADYWRLQVPGFASEGSLRRGLRGSPRLRKLAGAEDGRVH